MSRCANTEALSAYESDVEDVEKKYERVEKLMRNNLVTIGEQIDEIKSIFESEGLEFDLDFVLESL
jgi:hypothetical protein